MDIQNIITFFSLLVNVLAVITFYITVRKYRDENKKGEMIGDYYGGLSTIGTKSRNSELSWPAERTEEVLLQARKKQF